MLILYRFVIRLLHHAGIIASYKNHHTI